MNVINGILSGKTKQNSPLLNGMGESFGAAELLLEVYILDPNGNLKSLYFPWIIKDRDGNYHSGTYSGSNIFKSYSTKTEAFEDWKRYGGKHGGFVLGRQVSFNLADDPKTDSGPGSPLYDSNVFDYWNGREENLKSFLSNGDPGELIMLGTNVRFSETIEIK
jgi:hypothetical protein